MRALNRISDFVTSSWHGDVTFVCFRMVAAIFAVIRNRIVFRERKRLLQHYLYYIVRYKHIMPVYASLVGVVTSVCEERYD